MSLRAGKPLNRTHSASILASLIAIETIVPVNGYLSDKKISASHNLSVYFKDQHTQLQFLSTQVDGEIDI